LKLKHDEMLSNFAFNCNLRLYDSSTVWSKKEGDGGAMQVDPRF